MTELDEFREQWRSEVQARNHSHHPTADDQTERRLRPDRNEPPEVGPLRSLSLAAAGLAASDRQNDSNPGPSLDRSLSPRRIFNFDHAFRAERPKDVYHNKDLSDTDLAALDSFEKAVDNEHSGQLSDAVKHYRDAFKLNEKVDKLYREKYYRSWKTNTAASSSKTPSTSVGHDDTNEGGSKKRENDLIESLEDLSLKPADEDEPCPIMNLPVECVINIMRFLALEDLSSFTRFTYTCKKFAYIGYSTQSIWRSLCKQAFDHQYYTPNVIEELYGHHVGDGDDGTGHDGNANFDRDWLAVNKHWDGSWRKMYLDRPRIKFNGVYISTCNYLRPGVGQTWSAPIHMVTYYRYCRFYEDGTCINLLTTSEPSDVVPVFSRRVVGGDVKHTHLVQPIAYTKDDGTVLTRPKGITHGTWTIDSLDGKILIESEGSVDRYIFYMNLQIRSSGLNRHNKLKWIKFWSVNRLTQDHGNFTLRHDKAFFFVRTRF